MTSRTLDLLRNPIRVRIIHALYDGRDLTTAQLCSRLADVSPATVYRHVAKMERAGALDVVGEHKIRGVVERTYRLRRSAAQMTEPEIGGLTVDDFRRAMHTITSVMLAEFERTLGASGVPPRPRTSLAQLSVWLKDSEMAELRKTVFGFISRHRDNRKQGRRRYLLTPSWFCMAQDEADSGTSDVARPEASRR